MPVNQATTTRKIISMPHEMVAAVAAYRFSNHIETEAEAIRRLVEMGLKAAAPDKAPLTPTSAEEVR